MIHEHHEISDDVEKYRALRELVKEKRNRDLVRALLINRYRILLTQGICGMFVVCENEGTGEYFESLRV